MLGLQHEIHIFESGAFLKCLSKVYHFDNLHLRSYAKTPLHHGNVSVQK